MNTFQNGSEDGSLLAEDGQSLNYNVMAKKKHRGGRRKKREGHYIAFENDLKFISNIDTWGDDLQITDSWPMNMSAFRILGCNLGGISHYNDMVEWE